MRTNYRRPEGVVPYQYSTSNRNVPEGICWHVELFLINILHQTATSPFFSSINSMLFLINILHQTATMLKLITRTRPLFLINILHQTATLTGLFVECHGCSLSIFYIKPQRVSCPCNSWLVVPYQYSTSNRNVTHRRNEEPKVVPYQYSTSNRNLSRTQTSCNQLFLINILHQTATYVHLRPVIRLLFLINILHQTATYTLYLIHNQ